MNTNKQDKPEVGTIKITREHFIEIIEAMKNQCDYDILCCGYASKIYPDAFEANLIYNNSHLSNTLFKLIQMAFNDDQAPSWIEHFCWELDFGRDYVEGCVKRKGGTNVDLSNAGKLYDFLFEEEPLISCKTCKYTDNEGCLNPKDCFDFSEHCIEINEHGTNFNEHV